ncbi:MAG: MFS transporter [Chloroflexi bacterium]|nr:MFS transporter [Chloroflexota bacterium]
MASESGKLLLDIPRRKIVITLAGIMLGMLLAALNQTTVVTAMPRIVASLGGMHLYSWVFTSFLLCSTIMMPIFGKMSDIFGRRPLFLIGLSIFMVGSMLGGLAQSMEQLIVFRGVQGIGAAAIMPLAMAIIGDIFPPKDRAKFQGAIAGLWGVASILGPVTGGYVVDNWHWRWVFYMNLPLGLLSAMIVFFGMPKLNIFGAKRSIDYRGATVLSVGLVLFLLSLLLGGKEHPWNSPLIGSLFGGSSVLLLLFLSIEKRAEEPLIPLSLFGNPIFVIAIINGFLLGMSMFAVSNYIPLFLQGVMGSSATNSGLVLVPQMGGMIVGSVLGGQLVIRLGYRLITWVGGGLLAFGSYLLTTMSVGTTDAEAILIMIILGLGIGLTMPTFIIIVQNSVEHARIGIATSSLQFFRNMGGTIGVTFMGALLTSRLEEELTRQPAPLQGGSWVGTPVLKDPQLLLNSDALSGMPPALIAGLKVALANSLHMVFLAAMLVAAISFFVGLFIREAPLRTTWHTPLEEASQEMRAEVFLEEREESRS